MKFYKRITAIIFILVIFLFGAGTFLKCYSELGTSFREKGFSRDAINEVEASIQENFKSRYTWVNLFGIFQRTAGATYIHDSYIDV